MVADSTAFHSELVSEILSRIFESFFTLVTATSTPSRLRALQLAGAPTDLDDAREQLVAGPAGPDNVAPSEQAMPATVDEDGEGGGAGEETSGSTSFAEATDGRIPLYRVEDLIIEGVPLLVGREAAGDTARQKDGGGGGGGGGWRKGLTDLDELDRTGMAVALLYARNRIRAVHPAACIFDPERPLHDAVFRVSTPALIALAKAKSAAFTDVMAYLAENGLSDSFPGIRHPHHGP
jgi:hypothetical protein